MKASELLTLLKANGFNFFTGVPCSYITSFCHELSFSTPSLHIPAVREDIAVGMAAGAFLVGKRPVVYMQNGGLGYSLEALSSLLLIYKIPCLLFITYRGPNDPNMEEHLYMGQNTEKILKNFNIQYSILHQDISFLNMKDITNYLVDKQLPYCLLVGKGVIQ